MAFWPGHKRARGTGSLRAFLGPSPPIPTRVTTIAPRKDHMDTDTLLHDCLDRYGLTDTLRTLVAACNERASHCHDQDEKRDCLLWRRAAKRLARLAENTHV